MEQSLNVNISLPHDYPPDAVYRASQIIKQLAAELVTGEEITSFGIQAYKEVGPNLIAGAGSPENTAAEHPDDDDIPF